VSVFLKMWHRIKPNSHLPRYFHPASSYTINTHWPFKEKSTMLAQFSSELPGKASPFVLKLYVQLTVGTVVETTDAPQIHRCSLTILSFRFLLTKERRGQVIRSYEPFPGHLFCCGGLRRHKSQIAQL
jgi:hypothetical protein